MYCIDLLFVRKWVKRNLYNQSTAFCHKPGLTSKNDTEARASFMTQFNRFLGTFQRGVKPKAIVNINVPSPNTIEILLKSNT